jgi:NAD(P)-dependent dehydrogenase (short-subunit alcohol dehydrogenase family)
LRGFVVELEPAAEQQREQPARALFDRSVARQPVDQPSDVLSLLRGESVTYAPAQPVALVTGAGRGIGREIALALAREGCAVAVAARSADQVQSAAAAVGAAGARSLALVLDVTDERAVAQAIASIAAELGPVDVLVNNAGIAESAPIAKTDPALWERHLRVNATAPYLLARAVLPAMLERKWGRVINIASLAGLVGAPYVAAYTASKHALVGLTRALAAEVAGKGVTVNAICPGFAATDIVWNGARNIAARTGRSFEEAVGAMARLNPGGRLIEPAEVAAVAAKLLRDDSTNGEAIVLDGTP